MDGPRLNRPSGRKYQIVWRQGGSLVRISTGTDDAKEAERLLKIASGQLAAGQPVNIRSRHESIFGPDMLWVSFRELYRERLRELRDRTAETIDSRLNVIERIARPRTLGDFARHETMLRVRNQLVKTSDSLHTARSRMSTYRAALNWAAQQNFISHVPKVPPIKTSNLKAARGRPLDDVEVSEFLIALRSITGSRSPSWLFLAHGLLNQCLRLGESLKIHWTDREYLVPDLKRCVLWIPAAMQKNDTEEFIPMMPDFADMLEQCQNRQGFVFNPLPMRPGSWKRVSRTVGRTFSEAGEKAGVLVEPGRHAAAHDLRRTGIQWMIDAGVPERLVQAVARHASFETTRRYYSQRNAERDAQSIREIMRHTKSAHTQKPEST